MNAVVFEVLSCFIAIGAALLARRQLVIIWALALHIFITNFMALFLVVSGLMDSFDPSYFIIHLLLSFIASMVLYQYWNDKTLYPYLAVLASSIMCYFVVFEYFTGSSAFYNNWEFVMTLIITAQIVLIANIGGSIGTIRRYWRVSRNNSVSYGHSHFRDNQVVIPGLKRNAEGDR